VSFTTFDGVDVCSGERPVSLPRLMLSSTSSTADDLVGTCVIGDSCGQFVSVGSNIELEIACGLGGYWKHGL